MTRQALAEADHHDASYCILSQGNLKCITKTEPLLLLHRLVSDQPSNFIPTGGECTEQDPFCEKFPNLRWEIALKKGFLVSGAFYHSTQIVSAPWLQQETRSMVDNLALIAIPTMKANFGVACENQIFLPHEHFVHHTL